MTDLPDQSSSTFSACGCNIDEDGIVISLCPPHDASALAFETRVLRVLDSELDQSVKELAGRSPTRVERKVGATGTFSVGVKPP